MNQPSKLRASCHDPLRSSNRSCSSARKGFQRQPAILGLEPRGHTPAPVLVGHGNVSVMALAGHAGIIRCVTNAPGAGLSLASVEIRLGAQVIDVKAVSQSPRFQILQANQRGNGAEWSCFLALLYRQFCAGTVSIDLKERVSGRPDS